MQLDARHRARVAIADTACWQAHAPRDASHFDRQSQYTAAVCERPTWSSVKTLNVYRSTSGAKPGHCELWPPMTPVARGLGNWWVTNELKADVLPATALCLHQILVFVQR